MEDPNPPGRQGRAGMQAGRQSRSAQYCYKPTLQSRSTQYCCIPFFSARSASIPQSASARVALQRQGRQWAERGQAVG